MIEPLITEQGTFSKPLSRCLSCLASDRTDDLRYRLIVPEIGCHLKTTKSLTKNQTFRSKAVTMKRSTNNRQMLGDCFGGPKAFDNRSLIQKLEKLFPLQVWLNYIS